MGVMEAEDVAPEHKRADEVGDLQVQVADARAGRDLGGGGGARVV
jgi:hypothetical protein